MTETVSILPAIGPYERAFSLAYADQPRLPVELLASLYDPRTCPARLLPYLAWAFSVDLWKDDWSEEKKRSVIAATPALHRLKGTKPGLARHLEIVGISLVGLRQPPDKFMPDADLTKEESEAYLSRFRQIRVYSHRSRGRATFQAYDGMGLRRRGLFTDWNFFPGVSDAAARIGRRAFLYDPLTGIEEPIVRAERQRVTETREAETFEQFALRGERGLTLFTDVKPSSRMFLVNSGAEKRIYSMQIRQSYQESTDILRLTGVLPDVRPVDVRPRQVAERGKRVFGQLFAADGGKAKNFLDAGGKFRIFLPAGTAHLRLYEQIFLHEQDRLVGRRMARTFTDAGSYLGLPAHHLVAKVEIRRKRSRLAFGRFFARGFLIESDATPLADAVMAARAAKAAYEKLVITSRTHRPATVGDRLRVNDARVGEWVKT